MGQVGANGPASRCRRVCQTWNQPAAVASGWAGIPGRSDARMQAIILAAGYGRRMRPLSDSSHKALLPIGSTTILARIVDGLREIEIDDITVVTGYRAEDIERYLRERYPQTRLQFVHNPRYKETNNIVSLSMGLEQMDLEDDLVLVECDLLFEPGLLRRLLASDANIALVDHYRT